MHTFYEAVGYMIGAQTDQAVQEHLIEKYMLLPNQVWDSIIQQATKVRQPHLCIHTTCQMFGIKIKFLQKKDSFTSILCNKINMIILFLSLMSHLSEYIFTLILGFEVFLA